VDCVPGAKLILGFEQEHTRDELRTMIENDTMQDFVRFIDINPGDCYCIPAGLLHAICEGVLIAELQQNSNVTYRVYDYGRLGADGQPRELHIKKALDVTNTTLKPEKSDYGAIKTANYIQEKLADWDYFNAWKLNLFGRIELNASDKSFQTLTCLAGSATLQYGDQQQRITKGESIFIPAGFGTYLLEGDAEFFFVEL
jgi:mannose-6-phosphate isomerase